MAGKFNKKTTPTVPTKVNDMGERAYQLSPMEELYATCSTTFLQDSYYEKEKDITARIVKAIRACNDPLFVAKLAIYLRHKGNMRSVSHLLAGELSSMISGEEWAKRFYMQVYNRPDDMAEILAYIFSKQKKRRVPAAVKKAFANILATLDPYTIDKYKMKNRTIKLVDLVNLMHPKPAQKNAEAYSRLMKGKSLAGLYKNQTTEQALSAAGQKAKDSKTEESVDELKGDAIRKLLTQPKGMPIMSLIRNLRNLLLYAPDMVGVAVEHLTDEKRILNSRQLPFRFATAYNELEKMNMVKEAKSAVKFEKEASYSVSEAARKQLLTALEIALEISCQNIPKLEGNTAILIDHSGSVRGDGGGSGKLSAFGVTTGAMVGNLLATMYGYAQDNVYIGLFGDNLINVPINRKMGMIAFNNHSFREGGKCGGGTENGLYIFLNDCIKNKIKVDNLIIFSDMVIGSGGVGGWDHSSSAKSYLGTFQELFKKFKAVNPKCNTISVDIRQTKGTSVFDKSLNVTQVAGWSTAIFDTIGNAGKGFKAILEEINSIQI